MTNEGNKQGFYREWKIQQLGMPLYEDIRLLAASVKPYREYEKKALNVLLKSQYRAKEHLGKLWAVTW